MEEFNYNAHKKKARWIWFFILGAIWIAWIVNMSNDAYNKAAAESATKTGLGGIWSRGMGGILNSDADNAQTSVLLPGFAALIVVWFVAHFIAVSQTDKKKAAFQKEQELQTTRQRQDFAKQMETIDEENSQQTNLSKIAQSKQELIMRLGTIDGFIRVLGVEKDDSQRTVALQAAHSEITTLAAKLSSGQISRETLADSDIREQASETSKDLARIGLSDDRLNRDLIRIFKLS